MYGRISAAAAAAGWDVIWLWDRRKSCMRRTLLVVTSQCHTQTHLPQVSCSQNTSVDSTFYWLSLSGTCRKGASWLRFCSSLHPKKKKKNLWGFPSHLSAHVWMHLFHTVCKYDVCLLGCLVIRQPAESESGSKLGYPSSQGEKNTLRRIWRAKSLDDAPWLISDAQPVRDHKPNRWCFFVTRNNLKDLQFFAPTAYDSGAWSGVWYYANFTLSTFSDNIKCF